MEGNTNWGPNKKDGDSLVNNANDWRSQLEPDLRKKIIHVIVERLKRYFPKHPLERINDTALKFEDAAFRVAATKGDYMHKIKDRMDMMELKFRNAQSGSAANGTTTAAAAQVVNQGQSLPTSLPYTQTPTSQQQWVPQNIQSNLNIPGSSGLQNQVSVTVSGAQNINIQMSEGVPSTLRPGSQIHMQGRQPQQNPNYTLQHLMDQQLLKDKIRHGNLRPPAQQQQSLLNQSFPQSSALSSQQNSQFVPRHQFPTQPVRSTLQLKREEQTQLTSQLMNGPDTHQNHPTSQQGAFRVSSSQQNNISGFQAMSQQNINLLNMHQRRLSSQNNNASALPLQQQQKMLGGQSGNFNVPGSSLLGTQGQEVKNSQPMRVQQSQQQHPMQQQSQHKSLQQRLDFLQNDAQRNQPSQLQRAPPEHSSTSQDSTGQTVNVSGGDWQEETYQKIKALKDTHITVLQAILQKVKEKLRQENDSLPQNEATERLRGGKSTLEQMINFLNVPRSEISETHRDRYSACEQHILRMTRNYSGPRRPIQQQQAQCPQMLQTATQSQSPLPQVHMSQCLDNNQMNSRLMMPSYQDGASSSVSSLTTSQAVMPRMLQTRHKMEPGDEKNTMASSVNTVYPTITSVQSSMKRQQQHQTNEINDVKMRQGINIKAGLLQQHLSSSQRQLPATVNKTETPTQFVAPSPVTSFAPSPIPGEPENPISIESPVSHGYQFQTGAQSPCSFGAVMKPTLEHPPFTLPPEPSAQRPIDRLIKAFQSSSPKSLAESVSEMSSVISMADRFAGSFHPDVAEDLSARTEFHLQAHGETNPFKRLKRPVNALPLDMASRFDNFNHFSSLESEVDSTASSGSKVNKIESGYALLQEIKEINGTLVETMLDICNEEITSGTIVTCSYAPVALSASFKAHYKSGQISQIQPLRLLVPANYPYSPPKLLDQIPFDAASVHKYEDLSARTRLRFGLSMRKLSEPASLKEIAQTWNDCARETMVEYAERHGGGTFSSKYGSWETILRDS